MAFGPPNISTNVSSEIIGTLRDFAFLFFDEVDSNIFFVDGHGDMGRVHFSSDIDLADSIHNVRSSI